MAYVVPSGFLRSDTNYKSEIAKLGELWTPTDFQTEYSELPPSGRILYFQKKSGRADYRNRLQALATDTYF